MISKATFIETMLDLEKLDKKMDNVDTALKELCPDFGGFYITDPFSIIMNLLANPANQSCR